MTGGWGHGGLQARLGFGLDDLSLPSSVSCTRLPKLEPIHSLRGPGARVAVTEARGPHIVSSLNAFGLLYQRTTELLQDTLGWG